MGFDIKEINYSKTWPIRHTVMWPDHPIAYIKLPLDKTGTHYGLFIKEKLVSIISLFKEDNEIQFRKFATLNEYQGMGYGTALLNFIIEESKKQGISKIWCNARANKADVYLRFGLQKTDKKYTKGGIDFIIMQKIFTH